MNFVTWDEGALVGGFSVPGCLAIASAALVAATACRSDDFAGAAAEVPETNIKLDLPAVPQFNMPTANPDGSHSTAEMRLRGNKFLDTEVRIKGFVIWKYDCATAIRTPEMSDKDVQHLLRNEPERCNRPYIALADTSDSAVEKGVMIVDIPRPPREDERKNLPRAELAAWPKVPAFKVGQQVTVTGKWALKSPRGFVNSNGLLVYQSMIENAPPAAP